MTENPTTQTAKSNAADVAHEARTQASDVAHVAGDQLQGAWHDLRRDLRGQAAQQTERAGTSLRRLDGQLQALRSGDREGAGPLTGYADQLQHRVQRLAQRVEDDGFDGLVGEVRTFARRRPGLFLASAAAAGFVAGRLIRGAADNGNNGNNSNGATSRPDAAASTRPTPPLTAPGVTTAAAPVGPGGAPMGAGPTTVHASSVGATTPATGPGMPSTGMSS